MTIQILKTPNGEDLIVLPRADYERLVALAGEAHEELADIAAYDRAKAAFISSSAVALSADVSAMMLKGMALPLALRKWRG